MTFEKELPCLFQASKKWIAVFCNETDAEKVKGDIVKLCLDKERVKKERGRILNLIHHRKTKLITDEGLKNGCEKIFKELES